jgi:tripartite-type tricarboxylate transporter receptor subunit TctC
LGSWICGLCAALGLQLAVLPDAAAQQYPTRPIRNIYPFSPGGFGDIVLRAISAELTKSLGQPVVVENRAGANTMIGADACAKAPPDGHTLCMLTVDTLSYNPFLYKKPLYDAANDFEPIINLVYLTEGFLVNPALKANNLAEFIVLAKSTPGSLNYGTPAHNVTLFMEAFKRDTGTDIKMIPYKGPGDTVNALIGGEVQVGFIGIGNVIGHIKGGRIRPLAVDGTTRSPLFPDVPTLVEAGYRGVANRIWLGILGPAGIPKPIVARLNSEISRIVSVPAFQQQYITALGLEAILDSPEHFAQFIRENRARGEELVRQSGLRPE